MKSEIKTGVSLPAMLLVTFIVLKLCGVIAWSWVWVLAPAWAPPVVFTLVVFAIIIVKAMRS